MNQSLLMASIEKFEGIISWQEARKLNKVRGELIAVVVLNEA